MQSVNTAQFLKVKAWILLDPMWTMFLYGSVWGYLELFLFGNYFFYRVLSECVCCQLFCFNVSSSRHVQYWPRHMHVCLQVHIKLTNIIDLEPHFGQCYFIFYIECFQCVHTMLICASCTYVRGLVCVPPINHSVNPHLPWSAQASPGYGSSKSCALLNLNTVPPFRYSEGLTCVHSSLVIFFYSPSFSFPYS